jgi:hypothetical protein
MFELGTTLKNCVLFYNGKGLSTHDAIPVDGLTPDKVQAHLGNIPHGVEVNNLWYDPENDKVFSEHQYTLPRNAGKEQNFFLPSTDGASIFLHSDYITKIKEERVFSKQETLVHDNYDCVISLPEKYSKFKNKKIMIVSGGPSSKEVNWDKIDYDYLWTVNEFYKNEDLSRKQIDLLYLSSIVDFENQQLVESIENTEALLTFPLVTNYIQDNVDLSTIRSLTNRFKENSSYNYTRYSSTLGVGYKLIVLAIFSGASEIYTVGNDGFVSKNMEHAFDGRKQSPGWYLQYGDRFQDRQFVIFWDYIKKLQDSFGFKIYNLGEGKDYNISSSITKTHFPLTQDIYEAL